MSTNRLKIDEWSQKLDLWFTTPRALYINNCPTARPFLWPLREMYRVDNTFCKTSLSWLYFPLLFVLYYGLFLVKNYHGLSAIPSFLHRLPSQLSSRAWARKCHSSARICSVTIWLPYVNYYLGWASQAVLSFPAKSLLTDWSPIDKAAGI